jgi:hypothetical protein
MSRAISVEFDVSHHKTGRRYGLNPFSVTWRGLAINPIRPQADFAHNGPVADDDIPHWALNNNVVLKSFAVKINKSVASSYSHENTDSYG